MKRALIIGISGQAGTYLAESLLRDGYSVIGTYNSDAGLRRVQKYLYTGPARSCPLGLEVLQTDLGLRARYTQREAFEGLLRGYKPTEVYNLASIMYAPASWNQAAEVMHVNGNAVVALLEAVAKVDRSIRVFQAGSGDVLYEKNPMTLAEVSERRAESPYALSKLAAESAVKMFRHKYGLHASTGILFNMESPRREKSFFAIRAVRELMQVADLEVSSPPVEFQELVAVRDWGITPEYVEAMRLMVEAPNPGDCVISTGVSMSTEAFVVHTCEHITKCAGNPQAFGSMYRVVGKSENPSGIYTDPSHIEERLGWKAKTTGPDVVRWLVDEVRKESAVEATA